MSNDTDTRVVAAKYMGTTGTAIGTSPSVIVYNTKVFDTHSAYNTTTGAYTVPVPGIYKVSAAIISAGGMTSTAVNNWIYLTLRKNATGQGNMGYFEYQVTGTNLSPNPTGFQLVNCNAGDVLDVTCFRDTNISAANIDTGTTYNWILIERLSGPASIAATETVTAVYTNTDGATIGTSDTLCKYQTKEIDSHGSYSPSTGLFTVPVSGTYEVFASYIIQSAVASTIAGADFQIKIRKNGTSVIRRGHEYQVTGVALQPSIQLSGIIKCIAGDTIDVVGSRNSNISSVGFNNAITDQSKIQIARIGNYV
jgi:hypothetical protein